MAVTVVTLVILWEMPTHKKGLVDCECQAMENGEVLPRGEAREELIEWACCPVLRVTSSGLLR